MIRVGIPEKLMQLLDQACVSKSYKNSHGCEISSEKLNLLCIQSIRTLSSIASRPNQSEYLVSLGCIPMINSLLKNSLLNSVIIYECSKLLSILISDSFSVRLQILEEVLPTLLNHLNNCERIPMEIVKWETELLAGFMRKKEKLPVEYLKIMLPTVGKLLLALDTSDVGFLTQIMFCLSAITSEAELVPIFMEMNLTNRIISLCRNQDYLNLLIVIQFHVKEVCWYISFFISKNFIKELKESELVPWLFDSILKKVENLPAKSEMITSIIDWCKDVTNVEIMNYLLEMNIVQVIGEEIRENYVLRGMCGKVLLQFLKFNKEKVSLLMNNFEIIELEDLHYQRERYDNRKRVEY
ncbi:predicted protein [Naegleria gruberi]|uniref:Predicted protein n=1 Tax=Naegleria gruberi TaxID=5762 RepID=D2V3V8_NAEGR|nr:uncharacterized protein NAEGRDRAFT_63506 [Naegleria gruberi]EFC48264.1 predicted protein [Naegleria gruberi]|eukprot:XP_002681008.1 predicted protein [Naegleria gruberi strain NEG-M]